MRLFLATLLTTTAGLVWAADDSVFDQSADLSSPAIATPELPPGPRWSGSTLVEFGAVAMPLSGGALVSSTLALDADPQPGVHVRTVATASVPGAATLTLSELWAQASTAPSWFVRLGLQPLSWQTARVFSTVDLASHVGADLSARAQLILGPVTMDAIASAPVPAGGTSWGETSLASTSSLVSLDQVTGAGRVEVAIPGGALALTVRQTTLTEVSPSVRLSLGKVDLFSEALVQHQFGRVDYSTGSVIGFFTELSPVQLYGEWSWDDRRTTVSAQNQAVVAARWLHLVVPSGQLGFEWRHSFSDGTGRVLPGVSADLLPGVRTDLGVSFAYHSTGPSGLYFNENTSTPALIGSRVRLSVTY